MSSDNPSFESPSFPEEDLEDELDDEQDGLDDEQDGDEPGDGDEDEDQDDLEEVDGPEPDDLPREDEHAGNRLAGGAPRAVLEHLARSIVDDPDAVAIDVEEGRSGLVLSLHVAPGDMGRVIGKRGRVAQALRTVVRAAAAREGTDATVDIVD